MALAQEFDLIKQYTSLWSCVCVAISSCSAVTVVLAGSGPHFPHSCLPLCTQQCSKAFSQVVRQHPICCTSWPIGSQALARPIFPQHQCIIALTTLYPNNHFSLFVHSKQELFIVAGAFHLFEQEVHGLIGRHVCHKFTENPYACQFFLGKE